MSDLRFGGPPKNGKRVSITYGNAEPTPYHAEVWVNGQLKQTRKFASEAEAKRFQTEESAR